VAVGAMSAVHFGAAPIAYGALLACGGLLFFRKDATSQVLARSAAWSVIVPAVVVALLAATHGFVPPMRIFISSAMAAFALVASRPLLEDDEAQRTFAPLAMRRFLLASAAAAIASGIAIGELALGMAHFNAVRDAFALGALAALLAASGVGLARMRTWGVALGALSSVVALALHHVAGAIVFAAVPGLMMLGGIIAARLRVAHRVDDRVDNVRIRISDPACTRVEEDDLDASEDVTEASRSKMISA
jgi:hypothetical protein